MHANPKKSHMTTCRKTNNETTKISMLNVAEHGGYLHLNSFFKSHELAWKNFNDALRLGHQLIPTVAEKESSASRKQIS